MIDNPHKWDPTSPETKDLIARANKTMSCIRTMIRIILTSAILGLLWLLWRLYL
jgi:hypothetical protein